MKIKKVHQKSYDLTMIKTDDFKSFEIRALIKVPFNKETITLNTLLIDYLTYSTSKHDTRISFINYCRDLYGLYVDGYSSRIGNSYIFNIVLSSVHPKYVDDDLLEKSIDLIREILLEPNVKNDKFDSKIFKLLKSRLKGVIEGVKDDQARYAELMMLQTLDKDKPYAYNIDGNLKDLKKISEDVLYQYYKKIINNCSVDFYIAGDINFDEVESLFDKKMASLNGSHTVNNIFVVNEKNKKIIMKIENSSFKQSKLSIGCKVPNNNIPMFAHKMIIYNNILGTIPSSKLFSNVREKFSYAYYINSSYNLADNTLTINSGIKKENLMNVLNQVKIQMKNLKDGVITDDELDGAKNATIESLNSIDDDLSLIIRDAVNQNLLKYETKDERINIINEITKDDIVEVAKLIDIDAVFLLEEGEQDARD